MSAGQKRKSAERKDTNPKDAVGTRKVPVSTVPGRVVMQVALAMLEGARKYGRHNYRVSGVRASVYHDAAMRHLTSAWEGQWVDPDSGLPHLVKAIASLVVWMDAVNNGKCVDDRPPRETGESWMQDLNDLAGRIIDRYPEPKEPWTQVRVSAGRRPPQPSKQRARSR